MVIEIVTKREKWLNLNAHGGNVAGEDMERGVEVEGVERIVAESL